MGSKSSIFILASSFVTAWTISFIFIQGAGQLMIRG